MSVYEGRCGFGGYPGASVCVGWGLRIEGEIR